MPLVRRQLRRQIFAQCQQLLQPRQCAGIVLAGAYNYDMSNEDREWMSRLGALLLIAVGGWLAATGLVIFGPWSGWSRRWGWARYPVW